MRRAGPALIAAAILAGLGFGGGAWRGPAPAVIDAVAAGFPTIGAATGSQPAPPTHFYMRGHVSGLYPGATVTLQLRIANPALFPIDVTSVTTAVATLRPACPAGSLTVAPFTGSFAVPARQTATLPLAATLARAAPNACQGAVFPLQYSGLAVKA